MKYQIRNKKIFLLDCYAEREIIKRIPGRRWHAKEKYWSVDYTIDNVEILNKTFQLGIPKIRLDTEPYLNVQFNIPHLYSHQKASVSRALANNYFADLSQPGTGKTLVQIELLLQRKDSLPALIICPKSIMEVVWKRQLEEIVPNWEVEVLSGSSADVKHTLWQDLEERADIYILNYDKVDACLEPLLEWGWQTIILDESTKIKTHTAKRSKAVIKLRERAKYRSIMTGTVAPNGLLDVFNQFRFLNPQLFGQSFYAFREFYFQKISYRGWDEWECRPESFIIFRDRAAHCSVQHKKRDCVDLPPIVFETRMVDMAKEQAAAYEQMKKELILEIDQKIITAPFASSKMMKLRQIASGFIYSPDGKAMPIIGKKIAEVDDILQTIGEQQLIIFCHFRTSAEIVHQHLCERGIKTGLHLGGTSNTNRQQILKEFEDGRISILVANIASAAHGLNLQFCSNIIFFELDFSLETYEQAWQRIERIGQQNKMTVWHLITRRTLEKWVLEKLQNKINLNKMIDIGELKRAL